MRIISGRFRGRRLAAPTWAGVRPTSDGLRETLFNVIGERVTGARVLDAFAGTGAIGLEALSRGARHVTFVDRDRRAAALAADNVARCGAGEACAIIRADVAALRPGAPGAFDLVIADPPYEGTDLERILAMLGPLVAAGGLLVLEHAKRRVAPPRVGALARVRQVVSGDSALAVYACRPEAGAADGDAPGDPDAR